LVLLVAVVYRHAEAICPNAKVTTDVFATTDLIANSTIVVNIDIRCDKALEKDLAVFGMLEPSRTLLVGAHIDEAIGANTHRFQISFIDADDTTLVSGAGQNTLRIYDDQGFAAYRKALREGQDTSAVSTLATVPIAKPSRPSRLTRVITCEHWALLIGVVSIYSLYTLKSKLTN